MKRFALALCLVLAGCGSTHHQLHHKGFATLPPPGGLRATPARPSLEMFDTITLSTVPSNPRAVAGYTSGYWPTYNPLVKAYPHALHVSIAITARRYADCLDDEPGDATPSQVVGWVRMEQAAGHPHPCVYSSVSQMFNAINPRLSAAGLGGVVRRWCAWYRYVPGLIAGCDAVQWTDHAFGRNLDESTVALSFFGIRPPKPHLYCFGPRAQLKNRTCVAKRALAAREFAARNKAQHQANVYLAQARAHDARFHRIVKAY